jgi:hypothetical protein
VIVENRAITVGRMVGVALSGLPVGAKLRRVLQGESAAAAWALGEVKGIVHGERLYEPRRQRDTAKDDKAVAKCAKRKRMEGGASTGKKVPKLEQAPSLHESKGLRKPNFDEADEAMALARRADISILVSWWGVEGENGKVGASGTGRVSCWECVMALHTPWF